MGDERRQDSDRDTKRDDAARDAQKTRAARDAADAQFDGAHAKTAQAYQEKISESGNVAAKMVDAVGDDVELTKKYETARDARDPNVVAIVRDMSTDAREVVGADLSTLAEFLPPRDVLLVGDLAATTVDATLAAALAAAPKLDVAALRAYLSTTPLFKFGLDDSTVTAMRDFAKDPLELVSEFDDLFASPALVAWFFEVNEAKTVARWMLSIRSSEDSIRRTNLLLKMGDAAWGWLDAVDPALAAGASTHAIEWFKWAISQFPAKEAAAVSSRVAQLEKIIVAQAGTTRIDTKKASAALRKDKADVLAKSIPAMIGEMRAAGLPAVEQFTWILDLPAVTPSEVRAACLMLNTPSINRANADRLVKMFPKTPIGDLFDDVPPSLISIGGNDPTFAKWMLQGAQPEQILEMAGTTPDLVALWCSHLTRTGVGFGWVQQLGGRWNDQLLRRFALACPDQATVKYIEERLLGMGDFGRSRANHTVERGQAITQDAYSTAESHLDADLAKKWQPAERIAGDVEDLTDAEEVKLSKDPARRKQVLATANKQTFPMLLDHVDATLPEVAQYATPQNVSESFLISWSQKCPAQEVSTVLESAALCARYRAIVQSVGLLEALPAAKAPAVMGPALKKSPALLGWLLESEPGAMLSSVSTPSALDAMARALVEFEELDVLDERLPLGDALGVAGRSVYAQLSARTKGDLRKLLQRKLDTKVAPEVKGQEREIGNVDHAAETLRNGKAFVEQLDQLLLIDSAEASLLALCKTAGMAWQKLGSNTVEDLKDKLRPVSPIVAFPGARLSDLLQLQSWHRWVFETVPGYSIIQAATGTAIHKPVAKSLEVDVMLSAFVLDAPRGRALSATNKATLHRIAEVATEDVARALFAIAFDLDSNSLPSGPTLQMWSLLERVPEAHADQRSIHKVIASTTKSIGGAGYYLQETRDVVLATDTVGEKQNLYDTTNPMTEAEAIEALGSKEQLQQFVDQKRIAFDPATNMYSFVPKAVDIFNLTVLHEVGHAVDAMLGSKTEFTYGLAGWKRFPASDFDGWAQDLGGWDQVSAPDKKEIARAWVSWLHGGGKGAVESLVDFNHPLRSGSYRGVGVVDLATSTDLQKYGGMSANGRRGMTRHKSQEFFSLSEKAHDASPSKYAMSAPDEYFAECYAHYYVNFTQGTTQVKGESVAPWIKTWFDTNIDTVGHNPRRNKHG